MSESPWKEFVEKTKERGPRPLLVKALALVHDKDEALDLGAGALNDSKYLLEQGFKHVTAVDKENLAENLMGDLPKDQLSYSISSFEDFNFPEDTFDLINAQFSLPFIQPSEFQRVFSSMKQSLKPAGIFVGQLFGVNDDWSKNPNMSFHTREQVGQLLAGMEVVELKEEEKDEKPVVGKLKHWHVFHIIARAKS